MENRPRPRPPDRELPAAWAPIRPRTFIAWAFGLATLVLAVGVGLQQVGGGSNGPPEPSGEVLAQMELIDELERSNDCNGLQGELNDVRATLGPPGTEDHSRRASVMRYTENAMLRLECRIRVPLEIDNDGPLAGSTRSAYF